MKSLIFAAALVSSTVAAPAIAWEFPAIPSLKDQVENAKINEVTAIFQNDPYFAGKIVNIEMYGRKIAVDRTGEPNTTPPGTPPPSANAGLASLVDVLNGLDAGAKGSVGINVERKFTDEGVLIYEKWGIVVGGELNVKKEDLSDPKEDKTTGEKK